MYYPNQKYKYRGFTIELTGKSGDWTATVVDSMNPNPLNGLYSISGIEQSYEARKKCEKYIDSIVKQELEDFLDKWSKEDR